LVTGYVNIKYSDDATTIDVRVLDKYRHKDLVEVKSFSTNLSVDKGIISISSESPAFDFHACQHASIEIVIPKKYRHAISFTGIVKTGFVKFSGEYSVAVGAVDIAVEAGFIKVKHLNAQSLSLSVELGLIKAREIISVQATKLEVHTGFIKSRDIITKDFQSIVKYGGSRHRDVVADTITANTKWGYTSIVDVSSFNQVQNINMNTGYGKSRLLLNNPNLNFTLSNKKGFMLVEYENDDYKCHVEPTSTDVLLGGYCKTVHYLSRVANKAVISLTTDYGSSALIVDHYESDVADMERPVKNSDKF